MVNIIAVFNVSSFPVTEKISIYSINLILLLDEQYELMSTLELPYNLN
jgi:hypothetical protein